MKATPTIIIGWIVFAIGVYVLTFDGRIAARDLRDKCIAHNGEMIGGRCFPRDSEITL